MDFLVNVQSNDLSIVQVGYLLMSKFVLLLNQNILYTLRFIASKETAFPSRTRFCAALTNCSKFGIDKSS